MNLLNHLHIVDSPKRRKDYFDTVFGHSTMDYELHMSPELKQALNEALMEHTPEKEVVGDKVYVLLQGEIDIMTVDVYVQDERIDESEQAVIGCTMWGEVVDVTVEKI